jgi:hypothetical protein
MRTSIGFEQMEELRVGDTFVESEYGLSISCKVLTDPKPGKGFDGRKTLKWTAQDEKTGRVINYMVTDGFLHYGPHLYRPEQP